MNSNPKYAIRVLRINDSNALVGEPIISYLNQRRMYLPINLITYININHFLTNNATVEPDFYGIKEQVIVRAHELQKQLDSIRNVSTIENLKRAFKNADFKKKKYVEYFVKPVVWNLDKYIEDCKTTSKLCSDLREYGNKNYIGDEEIDRC